MPMYLTLVHRDDDLTNRHLTFIQQRRELARSLVPEGFEDYFRRHAQARSAHGSVSIEGNPLDFETVQLATLDDSSADHQHREARNADRAHRLVRDLAEDESMEIDVGLLRLLNSILLDGLPGRGAEQAGRFRRGGSMIINAATRQFVYTGPPAAWVAELMSGFVEQMRQWLHDDDPELVAAKAHFGFVSIHPFVDGNGRTARLLADLVLALRRCDVDGMISLSSVIRDRRGEYYEALQASQGSTFSERVDVTDFVRFHTGVIADAIRQLEARATAFQHRCLTLLSDFEAVMNDRRVVGVNSLLELGQLSSSQYAELANCAQPTAFSDLNALTDAGVALRLGRGKATRYQIIPEVRAMLEAVG